MKSKLIIFLILFTAITFSHLIGHFLFKKHIKKIIEDKEVKNDTMVD